MMKSLRPYSNYCALLSTVRCSRLHLQKSPSLPATSPKPQLRKTSTMAANTTMMQKSNRLRTAFAENNGPSYGIWVLLPFALTCHHQDHITNPPSPTTNTQMPTLY